MTDPQTESPDAPSRTAHRQGLGLVGATADARIRTLQYGYREDRPGAVSATARIRRGAGRSAGTIPDLWGMTGMELLDEKTLRSLDLARADEALHIAVTLWALHQQAHRDANMHVPGPGFGAAVHHLFGDAQDNEPIRKRFVRAGNAQNVDALAARLRELVVLMRREAIPLDYGLLAYQLYQWQRPESRNAVRRAWGRDFHIAAARAPQPAGTDKPQNS